MIHCGTGTHTVTYDG